jgi:hypothetical protein
VRERIEIDTGLHLENLKNGIHVLDLGIGEIILLEQNLKNSVVWLCMSKDLAENKDRWWAFSKKITNFRIP